MRRNISNLSASVVTAIYVVHLKISSSPCARTDFNEQIDDRVFKSILSTVTRIITHFALQPVIESENGRDIYVCVRVWKTRVARAMYLERTSKGDFSREQRRHALACVMGAITVIPSSFLNGKARAGRAVFPEERHAGGSMRNQRRNSAFRARIARGGAFFFVVLFIAARAIRPVKTKTQIM